jgi:hypothetical protein
VSEKSERRRWAVEANLVWERVTCECCRVRVIMWSVLDVEDRLLWQIDAVGACGPHFRLPGVAGRNGQIEVERHLHGWLGMFRVGDWKATGSRFGVDRIPSPLRREKVLCVLVIYQSVISNRKRDFLDRGIDHDHNVCGMGVPRWTDKRKAADNDLREDGRFYGRKRGNWVAVNAAGCFGPQIIGNGRF